MPKIAAVHKGDSPPEPLAEFKPSIVDDPRYFLLSEPIRVADKEISRLLIDTAELDGPSYFRLVRKFRSDHPDIARNTISKMSEEIYLTYVVAELNPPMVIEDVAKLDFNQLDMLFLRMKSFYFLTQAGKEEAMKRALMGSNGSTI